MLSYLFFFNCFVVVCFGFGFVCFVVVVFFWGGEGLLAFFFNFQCLLDVIIIQESFIYFAFRTP